MIPPRRAVRDGMPSDAGTPRDRENEITRIYNQNLKPCRGWKMSKSGLDDWTFIPPSLSSFKASHLRKHGMAGIHYAVGWKGLADMYEQFGADYAPTLEEENNGRSGATAASAEPSLTNTRRVTMSPKQQQQQGNQEPDDDEETVAYEQHGQGEAQGNPPVVVIEIKKEDEPVVVVAAAETQESSTQAVDRIMASTAKVNDQISWINDNPNEQTAEQAKRMKAKLARVKERLLDELDQYDSGGQVFL
jgi:hypothetical protein